METQRKIVNMDDVKPLGSRKKKNGTLIVALVIIIAAAAIGAVFFLNGRSGVPVVQSYTTARVEKGTLVLTTDASGTVVVPAKVTIVSPAAGFAGKVYASVGDTVTTDTVLAEIRVPDLEDELESLLSQLKLSNLSLFETRTDYEFSIANYNTSLARLEVQIADARDEVATQKDLLGLASGSTSEYDAAVTALQNLEEKKEDTLASLDRETKKRDIALIRAEENIKVLQTSISRLEEDIADARVTSPIPGEVLDISDTLLIEDNPIDKNAVLMTVANRDLTYIDLEVNEEYAAALKEGQEIQVTVGSTSLTAVIMQIGKTATMSSDGLSATVSVRTKPSGGSTLTPGASAVATLTRGTREDALTLPRGAWLTTGNQKYAFKVVDGKAYKTEIKVGQIQGTRVEITMGLEAGDVVITSGYQDYLASDYVELK